MPDAYWESVAKKVEEKKARARKNRAKLFKDAREYYSTKYTPIGRNCVHCRKLITEGGMLHPKNPHNAAFCGPECYGKNKSAMENLHTKHIYQEQEGDIGV